MQKKSTSCLPRCLLKSIPKKNQSSKVLSQSAFCSGVKLVVPQLCQVQADRATIVAQGFRGSRARAGASSQRACSLSRLCRALLLGRGCLLLCLHSCPGLGCCGFPFGKLGRLLLLLAISEGNNTRATTNSQGALKPESTAATYPLDSIILLTRS